MTAGKIHATGSTASAIGTRWPGTLAIKTWREVAAMRAQALAIALVIASGVAVYVMSMSTLDALLNTRAWYYQQYRFADLFVELERAPRGLLSRIDAIEGVERLEARVSGAARLALDGFDEPIVARLMSIRDSNDGLNRYHLRVGRAPRDGASDELMLSEGFAQAHGLQPGARIRATINGRQRTLRVTGIALSPEFIYQLAPGALVPDFERYAIGWMDQRAMESVFDMQAAFNNLAVKLAPGRDAVGLVDRLDRELASYGGHGAYLRQHQVSHHFLSEEFRQLQGMATLFPVVFFGVSAFLLHIVVGRLVRLQREQIAALKAFGYGNLAITLHYAGLVLLIVGFGVLVGVLLGAWLGFELSALYAEFYRFPRLVYVLNPESVAGAAIICIAIALLGTLGAIRGAVRLPPAQAMRPEPPALYRRSLPERLGLAPYLAQTSRMIVRHIERHAIKSGLSILGLALACGIMMVGSFQGDAIDFMLEVQFGLAQRQDLSVSFIDSVSSRAMDELRALEGIRRVEGARSVAVRLEHGPRRQRTAIEGLGRNPALYRLLDMDLEPVALPARGLVLSDHLARKLDARPGDRISVQVLEGRRIRREVPVAAITRQFLGMGAYMQREALNRLLGEGDSVTHAFLSVDPEHLPSIYARLNETPGVASTQGQKRVLQAFRDILEETIVTFNLITALLGGVIAFGVVYNTARIAFEERNRELASLRVLGFSRAEIAYVLLGELALLTAVAIPLGFLLGQWLCAFLAANLQSELYRIPLVLERDTYALAALVVIASASASALAVWRRLGDLDLVAVLKTRE